MNMNAIIQPAQLGSPRLLGTATRSQTQPKPERNNMKTTTPLNTPTRTLARARRALIAAGCLSLLVGLASAQPINYADNFESGSLNPFWTSSASGGSVVFPSTAQAHGGSQSVQFDSLAGVDKNIGLHHVLSQPSYGQVSVWVFDTGADQASGNYLILSASPFSITAFDYDLGPDNGGHYYYQIQPDNPVNTPVDRTQGWHQFSINATADSLSMAIDGTTVLTGSGGTPFTEVSFAMFGPAFRPAMTSYFDDFQANLVPVPEPSTLVLGSLGLVGLWFVRRRKT